MSNTTHRVVLQPTETPLAAASDVRLVDIELGTHDTSLRDAAATQLRDTDHITTYALHKYWDIHCVYALDADPIDKLQTALLATEYTPQHWPDPSESLRISVNARSNVWKPVTIGVHQDTFDEYEAWKTDLANTHPSIVDRGDRYLNHALIRTAAETHTAFPEPFFTDPPTAHDTLLSTALDQTDAVLDNYDFEF